MCSIHGELAWATKGGREDVRQRTGRETCPHVILRARTFKSIALHLHDSHNTTRSSESASKTNAQPITFLHKIILGGTSKIFLGLSPKQPDHTKIVFYDSSLIVK